MITPPRKSVLFHVVSTSHSLPGIGEVRIAFSVSVTEVVRTSPLCLSFTHICIYTVHKVRRISAILIRHTYINYTILQLYSLTSEYIIHYKRVRNYGRWSADCYFMLHT
jgi:hypothetical protein